MRRFTILCLLTLPIVASSVSARPAPTPRERVFMLLASDTPEYRAKIKEVMRFSGIYFVKRGRLDWLVRYFMM